MRLKYSKRAINSLEEILEFIRKTESKERSFEIRNRIIRKVRTLLHSPLIGQTELFLEYSGLGHRRLIEGNYKIIYRISEDVVYITDIFDSRQDPEKMHP